MIRYNEVSITTWISYDFKTLSPNGKLLWLYLLTGPVRLPIPGIYRSGVGTCTDDLGWGSDVFKKAFKELEERKMAIADWTFNVIMLPNWRKYNRAPANPNIFKSWLGMLDSIPDCDLKNEYVMILTELATDTGQDALVDLLDEWMSDRKDKLNRPEIKKSVVPVKEKNQALLDKKYSDLAYTYLKSVKKEFPKLSIFKNGSLNDLMGSGAIEIEKVCRLDRYAFKDIKAVLTWTVDSYDESAKFNWLSNLQSLRSLRKKGENGNRKFDNMYNAFNNSQSKKKKKEIDYSDVSSPI